MDRPLIALSQLGFPDTSFSEDVEIAKKVGAAGISPDEAKLITGSEEQQLAELENAGLTAAIGTPSTLTLLQLGDIGLPLGSPDPERRLEEIVNAMRLAAPLKPYTFLFITGPAGDHGDTEARRIVVEGIRVLASEAKSLGMRAAIEPMREENKPFFTLVASLRETLDLLDEAGADDVGIVFDTWHMWDSTDVYDMIPEAVDRIHGVQIADYRSPTRSPMDRVLAGDGIGRIASLLATFGEAGYSGWYDLEIFSDDGRFGTDLPDSLWKLPPIEYASRQVQAFMSCWQQADR